LQFLVLGSLGRGECTGREIRQAMSDVGVRKSGPGFYQLMARMEDAGLVRGAYVQREVGGQVVRERQYVVTGEGRKAWTASSRFYLEVMDNLDGGQLARA